MKRESAGSTLIYYFYLAAPAPGWNEDPELVLDQESALENLGALVSDHIYEFFVAEATTAKEAWDAIIAAFAKPDSAQMARSYRDLSELRYHVGQDPIMHLASFELLVSSVNFFKGVIMAADEKNRLFLETLPKDAFWRVWFCRYMDELETSWYVLR